MLRKTLTIALILASAIFTGSAFAESGPEQSTQQIQHIRNATIKVSYGETTFLIDPMLSDKGTYPGFDNTYRSELRNPLVDLPMAAEDVIAGTDAVNHMTLSREELADFVQKEGIEKHVSIPADGEVISF
ncbi:MAG TPA: hypothetical protein DCF92_05440 [Idiomarina sp.]|nr:hypothetical protein [Idiomarina sp.]